MLSLASFGYDGFRERTAWAAADDGFLVIDLNADGTRGAGDGQIDQRSELVLSNWGPEGSNGLQPLADATDAEGNLYSLPVMARCYITLAGQLRNSNARDVPYQAYRETDER